MTILTLLSDGAGKDWELRYYTKSVVQDRLPIHVLEFRYGSSTIHGYFFNSHLVCISYSPYDSLILEMCATYNGLQTVYVDSIGRKGII